MTKEEYLTIFSDDNLHKISKFINLIYTRFLWYLMKLPNCELLLNSKSYWYPSNGEANRATKPVLPCIEIKSKNSFIIIYCLHSSLCMWVFFSKLKQMLYFATKNGYRLGLLTLEHLQKREHSYFILFKV